MLKNGAPASGQTVTWQAGAGIACITPLPRPYPLPPASTLKRFRWARSPRDSRPRPRPASTAPRNALLSRCSEHGPEYATVEAVSGTGQSVSISGTPAQIVLRVHDMDGNPMAGGMVTLYQALYAWAPPCPPHGRCAQTELLGYQTATAISALDGTVSFTPAAIPGVATNTVGIAATGNTSTLAVAIEQHP